jgi:integrase/recombinase XerD
MTALAPHLTAFFREHLPRERACSRHTCDAYAYTFQLLLCFAAEQCHTSPSALTLEQLDAPMVLAFLDHIETGRGNSPTTRNARLAAIKSFAHFTEYRVPSAIEQSRRLLAIPAKRPTKHWSTTSPIRSSKSSWILQTPGPVLERVIGPCST